MTTNEPIPTNAPTAAADRDRLFDLAAAYCDGQATAAEVAQLEGRIEADESACRDFLAYALVHGQLAIAAESRGERPGPEAGHPAADTTSPEIAGYPEIAGPSAARMPGRPGWAAGLLGRPGWAAATIVACAAAVGVAAWVAGRSFGLAEPSLATVTDSRFVVPADGQPQIRQGQSVAAGQLAIEGGAVELTLRNGVTLLLDGPADVDLVDEMRAVLRDGNVTVRVPKGMSGYRLDTATATVLDLGTEFAVRAVGGMATDVQVYEGAVVASHVATTAGRAFPHRVEAGEAVRFSREGTTDPERLKYDDERFLRSLPPEPAVGDRVDDESLDIATYGTPSHGGIEVVPLPSPPAIDGRLDDWPQADGFRAFFGNDPKAQEWVEGRMAYDRENLYIAARVGDPAPLQSRIDPELDADKAWVGGGVQVRISTDRVAGWPVAGNSYGYYWRRNQPVLPTDAEKAAATNPKLNHLVMWHHAPSGRACLSIAHDMTHADHVGNPPGYRGAFEPLPDGKGYVLEYAIPWSLLEAADDPPRAGDVLAAAWQVHFADESGRIWRRQIVDVRNLHEPYRIGVWQRAATWGRAEFR